MSTQESEKVNITEIAEKAITLALLRNKNIVLRYEDVWNSLQDLLGEDADSVEGAVYEYTAEHYRYYSADDTSFDIVIPVDGGEIDSDLVKALVDEPDILEQVIRKLLDTKITGCTLRWTPAYEAYTRAREYFEIEENWDEFSDRTYAGWVKFIVKVNTVNGEEKYVIWEDVDYCNRCLADPQLSIGVQKCISYHFDKSEAEDP
jgi:hypothetical protein